MRMLPAHRIRTPARAGRDRTHGQAMVEAALLLPILILVLLLAVDLGRAYFAYVGVRNAAREAAMWGGQHPAETCASDVGLRDAIANELGVATSAVGCASGTYRVAAAPAGCRQFTAPSTYGSCGPAPWDPSRTLIYSVQLETTFQPIVPVVGFLAGSGFGGGIPLTTVNSSPVLTNYGS